MNKAIIIGRLGQDPEVRQLQDGTAVANLSIATTEKWKDKKTGEKKESTEWHRVVFFSRLAEICRDYLGKGSQVCVEGKLKTDKWQDKEGNTRYTTKINGLSLEMLGSNQNQANQNNKQEQQQQQPPQQQQSAGGFDDDIPFEIYHKGMIA